MFLMGLASLVLGVTYLAKAITTIESPQLSGSLNPWDKLYWIAVEGLSVSAGRTESFIMPSLLFLGMGVFILAYALLQRITERGLGEE